MKNKRVKLLIIMFLVLSLTGCTTYLKDGNGKNIKNETTGQILTKNILCKPANNKTLEIYESYNSTVTLEKKVELDKLKECKSMNFAGKDEGLWTNVFVRPLAFLIVKIGSLVKSYGLAIIIATILIRLVVWPLTKKTALQSENMKKAKPDLSKLESKYKNKADRESQMMKSQELMTIYKKYGINPMSGCLYSFIQIPLFFAFYEAIGRIPVIFEETFIGFQLGTSPLTAVKQGNYYYLILIIIIAAATFYSFKLNSGAAMSDDQAKQMKMTSNIMVVFMTIATFSISAGIAIYWVASNVFTIIQNLLVKRGKANV